MSAEAETTAGDPTVVTVKTSTSAKKSPIKPYPNHVLLESAKNKNTKAIAPSCFRPVNLNVPSPSCFFFPLEGNEKNSVCIFCFDRGESLCTFNNEGGNPFTHLKTQKHLKDLPTPGSQYTIRNIEGMVGLVLGPFPTATIASDGSQIPVVATREEIVEATLDWMCKTGATYNSLDSDEHKNFVKVSRLAPSDDVALVSGKQAKVAMKIRFKETLKTFV